MAKYTDIYDELRREIVDGKYAVGSVFPSERALMRRFNASRDSIRHAIDQLKSRKFVSARQGCGTKVVFGRGRRLGLIPCMANSEFFVPLAARISQVCQDLGYSLLFALADTTPLKNPEGYARRVSQIVRDFVEQGVVGVLYQPVAFVEGAEELNGRMLAAFDAAHIPVVLLDYDLAPLPKRSKYDVVGIDHVAAGARVVEHLVARGARRIHFFHRPQCSAAVENRLRGVLQGVAVHRLPWSARSVIRCEADDSNAIKRHFSDGPRPDAVVCGYDALALALEKHLRRLGLSVPGDMMLVGFDDRQIAGMLQLTSIHQPIEQIAEASIARLVQRMSQPDLTPSSILLHAPIVARASTESAKERKKRQ